MINIETLSSKLRLAGDGIWHGQEVEEISYPEDGNQTYLNVEDRSFWFIHRNRCISTVVKKFPPQDHGAIFDIGGGNGYVAQDLIRQGFDVVLLEPGISGAINAKRRGLANVVCATLGSADLPEHCISAAGLFDVLEHIEDDVQFLGALQRKLKKGSPVYLTVPAYSFLWSREDALAGHFRRYTVERLCKVLSETGYEIQYASYFFRFLPIPILLVRRLPYLMGLGRKGENKEKTVGAHVVRSSWQLALLRLLLDGEVRLVRKGRHMCFGASCLVVAKAK